MRDTVVLAASGALVDVDRLAGVADVRPTEAGSSASVGVAAPMVQPTLRRDGQADLNGDGYADLAVVGSVDRRNPDAVSWVCRWSMAVRTDWLDRVTRSGRRPTSSPARPRGGR